MFVTFFQRLKVAGVPATVREYLAFLQGLEAGVAGYSVEDFYYLARTSLVKDERNLDRFDRVFGEVFRGLDAVGQDDLVAAIPEEWLRKLNEKFLTDEEKAMIEALGGFEKIMEELKKRLAEQQGRHEGGSKWIGAGGTSPFGAYGYNPAGVRIGQAENRNNRAIKVWDKREFRDLDDTVEIGARNIKVALRRLRKFAREGAAEELDLHGTINATANRGYLDIRLVPERRNTVKVLLFLDVGGSMDPYVRLCEQLFSAARAEFKHLEYFYFHNCVYETVWRENRRRHTERSPTWEVLRTYPSDYKLIFVGDAAMSPFELTHPGGSVEHMNDEAGMVWLQRLAAAFPRAAWLNPAPERAWDYTPSTDLIRRLLESRMYPLTIEGLDAAMRELAR
jgi:uncharacterized protein with von Willebrand factor type A (vWA) domain